LETVSHNGLDTEVYDMRPADYTTTTTVYFPGDSKCSSCPCLQAPVRTTPQTRTSVSNSWSNTVICRCHNSSR